jgi:hypothetical protein
MASSSAHATARDLARARRAWDKIKAEHGVGARIARAVGVSRQRVHKWEYVPEKHVLLVQRITRIPCYLIRPDLYKREAVRPLESVAA